MDYRTEIQKRADALRRFFTERDAIGRVKEKMRHVSWELVMIFVLGFIVGFVLKDTVARTVTVGHDDYTVAQEGVRYDINALEQALNAAAENQEALEPQIDPAQEQQ